MASTISAGTTTGTAVVVSGDTTGNLAFQTQAGANTITVPNVTGTMMVSGNMPAFSAYKSVAQTLSAATFTKITFDVEEYDTNNNFASSRFTPTVAGYYLVVGTVNNASGTQTVSTIYKNGSQYKAGTNGGAFIALATAIVYCNGTTDYIELYGYLAAGGATGNAIEAPYFQACMIRGA
jgi:hypothetical protein